MSKVKMMSAKDKKKGSLVPRLRFPEFNGEWRSQPLGELAFIIKEKAGDRKCILMSIMSGVGLIPQIDKFGKEIAGQQYKNYIILHKNDFAYNKSSTKEYPEGFIAMYIGTEIAAVPNSIFTCFKIKVADIAHLYLNYLFLYNFHGKYLRRYITIGARSHGALAIDDADLLSLPIPYPTGNTSFKEQQRIADCLSSLDERIAAETNKLDALKAHKKGLLKQLFPAEGETLPALRFPKFRNAGEWEEVPLSKLVSSLDAGVSVNAGDRPATSEEMGILKTSAVTNGIFEPQENKVVLDVVEIGRMRESVRRNTIIISRMNTPALVGANAYVDTNFENIFLPDRLWAAKPKPDTSMRFISFILSSNQGRATLALSAKGSSGSMKNITKSDVLAFLAMIPSLPEQQRIADCLSSLDELITAQTQKIDLLKEHKKGLMQQLFPRIDEVRA